MPKDLSLLLAHCSPWILGFAHHCCRKWLKNTLPLFFVDDNEGDKKKKDKKKKKGEKEEKEKEKKKGPSKATVKAMQEALAKLKEEEERQKREEEERIKRLEELEAKRKEEVCFCEVADIDTVLLKSSSHDTSLAF